MDHHGRGLRRLLDDDALAGRVHDDFRTAGLDERRLAMLVYSEKLTLTPAEVTEDDIAALRSAGHSDRDILDIAEVVGYYAYVNRLASGLGVDVEGWVVE